MFLLASGVFNPNNWVAWTAVIIALMGIADRARSFFKERNRDKSQIKEALERAPQVREELEIGNFQGAIKGLLAIQEAQKQAYVEREIQRDKREAELEEEVDVLRAKLVVSDREVEALRLEVRELRRA